MEQRSGRGAERRLADSNCCKRLCRPLPNHSAKAPGAGHGTRLHGEDPLEERHGAATAKPRETRCCVSGANDGANHGSHCDSGPPCTVTTTGNGPAPSGSKRKTGTDSPSKLSNRCSVGSTSVAGSTARGLVVSRSSERRSRSYT